MIRAALLVLLLGLCGGVFGGAWAQGAPPDVSNGDRAAIRSVITRQLDAFRRDDGDAAYAFAAPNIRAVFPSAAVFLDMVRRGYPPVYRARDVEFSELAMREGALVQEVELVGPDGVAVLALYTMERDSAGGWRISACVLMPSVRAAT